jgi:D-beta-D-heptose 7-phosphate kinase / D-beta-D-heptose 1-phosphate adenosyltransferase
LTLALSAGLGIPAAAEFAQAAADVVVRRFGTSVCSTQELVEYLNEQGSTVLAEDALIRRLMEDRAAGRTIVFTNGCLTYCIAATPAI